MNILVLVFVQIEKHVFRVASKKEIFWFKGIHTFNSTICGPADQIDFFIFDNHKYFIVLIFIFLSEIYFAIQISL